MTVGRVDCLGGWISCAFCQAKIEKTIRTGAARMVNRTCSTALAVSCPAAAMIPITRGPRGQICCSPWLQREGLRRLPSPSSCPPCNRLSKAGRRLDDDRDPESRWKVLPCISRRWAFRPRRIPGRYENTSRCRLLVYEATLPVWLAELHYPLVFSEPPFQRAFWDVLQRIIQNDK